MPQSNTADSVAPDGTLALTGEETELLARSGLKRSTRLANAGIGIDFDAAAALARSLLKRCAIPEFRMRYFTSREAWPAGRGKSHYDKFKENCVTDEEIIHHRQFIAGYLPYFLFGPNLSPEVIAEFREKVGEWLPVTSGDIEGLEALAKKLVRANGLDPELASEEFVKLALDCGVDVSDVRYIRDAVRKMKCPKHAKRS